MSGTALSIGQFAELSAAVVRALPRNMNPADALAWANNGEKLAAALASALSPLATPLPSAKPTVLAARAATTVGPLTKNFDPSKFFKARKGLYVDQYFSSRVLVGASKSEPSGMVLLSTADLTRTAYDREIKAELAENHGVELWHIAMLIEAQPNGRDGPLLSNGYANIFYVGGFVVLVRWDAGDGEWYVYDWKLGGDRWRAGLRVFSRN
jgi:hypothetical protein